MNLGKAWLLRDAEPSENIIDSLCRIVAHEKRGGGGEGRVIEKRE